MIALDKLVTACGSVRIKNSEPAEVLAEAWIVGKTRELAGAAPPGGDSESYLVRSARRRIYRFAQSRGQTIGLDVAERAAAVETELAIVSALTDITGHNLQRQAAGARLLVDRYPAGRAGHNRRYRDRQRMAETAETAENR